MRILFENCWGKIRPAFLFYVLCISDTVMLSQIRLEKQKIVVSITKKELISDCLEDKTILTIWYKKNYVSNQILKMFIFWSSQFLQMDLMCPESTSLNIICMLLKRFSKFVILIYSEMAEFPSEIIDFGITVIYSVSLASTYFSGG